MMEEDAEENTMKASKDFNDMIDELANFYTKNAEYGELLDVYYEMVYASLEDRTEEEVDSMYSEMKKDK